MKSLAIAALAAGTLALAQPAAADGPSFSFGVGPSGLTYFSFRSYDHPRHHGRNPYFRNRYRHRGYGPYGYRPYGYGPPRFAQAPRWQRRHWRRRHYGYVGQRGWSRGPRFHRGYGRGWGYGR